MRLFKLVFHIVAKLFAVSNAPKQVLLKNTIMEESNQSSTRVPTSSKPEGPTTESNVHRRTKEWTSQEAVVRKAKELIGYTMAQKYPELRSGNQSHKGRLGELIEENHFGLKINNEARPDFATLGVELKTSPIRENSKGELVAKERISLGMIDYFQIIQERFHTSGFWKKSEHLLIIFYLHNSSKDFIDREIQLADVWNFTQSDLIIIQQDWNFIRTKVKYGLAHELSEGDTMYLGAATKGVNKSSLREQPNGSIRAKSRAYSLKTTYVNRIIQQWLNPNMNDARLIPEKEIAELEEKGFDEMILDRFRPFYGWEIEDVAEALDLFALNMSSKSMLATLSRAIMGVPGKSVIPEFEAAGITMKTIRLKPNGTPQESMSFPAFKFKELAEEKWLDSPLYRLLDESRFLFVVFDRATRDPSAPLILKSAKFWTMPQNDIDQARESWMQTQKIVLDGNIVKSIGPTGIRKTNLPGSKFYPIIHVRPHATTVDDTYPLPVPDALTGSAHYTKQSFWLGNQYLKQIIS